MSKYLNDTELIFVVLGVIYFSECVLWLPETAVVFTGVLKRLRLARQPEVVRRGFNRATLLPLFPFSRTVVTEEFPVACSPAGTAILAGEHTGQFIQWSELTTLSTNQRKLRLNGFVLKVSTSEFATLVVDVLTTLQGEPDERLAESILQVLHASNDVAAARERIDSVAASVASLRLVSVMLTFWVFVVGPYLYYLVKPHPELLIRYLIPFGTFWLSGIVLFWLSHRRLLPGSKADRSSRLMTLCLSPGSVMRAADAASRGAFASIDPSAIALAVMSPAVRDAFISRRLRELQHPVPFDLVETTEDFAAAHHWWTEQRLVALTASLKKEEVDPAGLLPIPLRDDDANSWCPRCLCQFIHHSGSCPDCPGIALTPF